MNTNLTQIAFILDRSSSMRRMTEEAIGGFNSFLQEQQKEEGEARFSLILFDHVYTPIVENRPIDEVNLLDEVSYRPRGMTALLDAIGRTIDTLGLQLAEMPEEERPGDVIVVILTDGLENVSRDYRREKIAQMVRHQEEKYGWEFLFLGASMESFHESQGLGIKRGSSHMYDSVEEGMSLSSKAILERRREPLKRKKKMGF